MQICRKTQIPVIRKRIHTGPFGPIRNWQILTTNAVEPVIDVGARSVTASPRQVSFYFFLEVQLCFLV